MWNSMHVVLHKILCKRNSSAAKNTHGNFWPGVSKFIFSSASQSSHSLTKNSPSSYFFLSALEGKCSSCLQLSQEAKDEPAGVCQSCCRSLLVSKPHLTFFGAQNYGLCWPFSAVSLDDSVKFRESYICLWGRVSQPTLILLCLMSCTVGTACHITCWTASPHLGTLGWKWMPGVKVALQCHTCLLGSFP